MFKKLFLLSLIIFASQSHAMKRPDKALKITVPQNNFPDYKLWVPDVQNIIINYATINTTTKKPKEAAYTVNALARTNKKINILINEPKFSDDLINTFARKFYCSHETIARYLGTKETKKRLALQLQLKKLCHFCDQPFKTGSSIAKELNTFITNKINLEFTYNHYQSQETLLMLSRTHNSGFLLNYFLNKGADINNCNSHGLTVLKYATAFPINLLYKELLKHPELIINQQNKHGESTLLRCLIRRNKSPKDIVFRISERFIDMIKDLLTAGADPELANNAGITPIDAAYLLRNEEIIHMIHHAIDQKHALTQ